MTDYIEQSNIFVQELTRIARISLADARKAWLTIHSPAGMAPERQARIYANLYGLERR